MRQASLHLSDVLSKMVLSDEEKAFKHYRNRLPVSDNNDLRCVLECFLKAHLKGENHDPIIRAIVNMI